MLAACGAARQALEPPIPPRDLASQRWDAEEVEGSAPGSPDLASAVAVQTAGDEATASRGFEEAARRTEAPAWLLLRAADAAKRAGDGPRATALAKDALSALARSTGSKRVATPELSIAQVARRAESAVAWLDATCIAASHGGEITLRSATDGAPLLRFDTAMAPILTMFRDADDGLVACSRDGECQGFAVVTIQRQFGERQPTSPVEWREVRGRPLSSVFLSRDRYVSVAAFGQGHLFRAPDPFFDALSLASLAAVSGAGDWLVAVTDNQVRVHHYDADAERRAMDARTPYDRAPALGVPVEGTVAAVEMGTSGEVVVIATDEPAIRLVELPSARARWAVPTAHGGPVQSMRLPSDDARLAILQGDANTAQLLTVLDTRTGEPALEPLDGVADVAFAPGAADLAALRSDGEIVVWRGANTPPRALELSTDPQDDWALACGVGRYRLPRWVCASEDGDLSAPAR